MKKVLELPAFRRLFVAYTLNELTVSIAAVALALLVYRRTGSALGAAAFFLAAEVLPALVAPFFVARLDQRAVGRTLAFLYALQALIFLALAWLVGRFALVPVLALALINGVFAVAARVLARTAWTSLSRGAGLLREANAIINGSFSVCFLLGPAIGGVIVAAGGTTAALIVNACVFVVIALTVVTARGLPSAVSDRAPAAGRLRSAFAIARADPLIGRLLTLQAVGMAVFTISIPVEVVFAQHTLHAGAAGYGLLLSAWGAGALVGSAIYARWRAVSSRVLMTVGAFAFAAGFALMASAPSLPPAVVGAAVAGVGNGVQIVAMRTALQEATPEKWMALILSLNESSMQAAPGIGILIGGGITALAGPRTALAAGAAASLIVGVAMWVRLSGSEAAETAAARTHVPDDPELDISDPVLTATPGKP